MGLPHLLIPMDDAAIGPLTGWDRGDSSNNCIKFLCSHGGKILPRPFDAQLKYVGGETRIISVPKDISFQQLMNKLSFLTKGDMILKYQVVSEDLDALVSVKSEEDVGHMLDEIANWESRGSGSRLRAFLFPVNPVVVENPMDPLMLEHRYIDVINGISRCSSNMNRYGPSTSSPTSPESCTTEVNNNRNITKMHKVQSLPIICNNNVPQHCQSPATSLHLNGGEKVIPVRTVAPPHNPNTANQSWRNEHCIRRGAMHYDDMNTHLPNRRMIDKTRSHTMSRIPSTSCLDMKPKFYI